jgi:hypothetical protein
MSPPLRKPKSAKRLGSSLIVAGLVGLCCFYVGMLMGASVKHEDCWSATDPRLTDIIAEQVRQQVKLQVTQQVNVASDRIMKMQNKPVEQETPRFPGGTVGRFATGMARVNRDEFAAAFDTGVPLDLSSDGNKEVLLLYNKNAALPTNAFDKSQAQSLTEIPLIGSVQDATENCDNLHVVLTDFNRNKQCIAIMGQYEAFHIQKFMRLPPTGAVDSKVPLRLVNRGAQGMCEQDEDPIEIIKRV